MKNNVLTVLAAVGIAASLLAGCSQPAAAPAEQPTTGAPSVMATECGSCDGLPQADHTGVSDPGWDEKAKTDAVDVAAAAMTLYNRPAVDSKRWIYDLAQYMTPQAGALYQGVNPANLPAFRTQGEPKLVIDPANGFGAHVEFSTNVGTFDFELLRQAANREWKISHIILPPGLH